MNKGEATKAYIVEQAAQLFNSNGYGSGSMSALMERTGLKKGGIYNHFGSKEELALEAFDYSIRRMNKKLAEVMRSAQTAPGMLRALLEFYHDYSDDTTFQGGCPMLNTAVESDSGHPALKQRVSEVLKEWQASLGAIIEQGKGKGEIRMNVNSEQIATMIISGIEGGIMLSRALDDGSVMATVCGNLWRHLERDMLIHG